MTLCDNSHSFGQGTFDTLAVKVGCGTIVHMQQDFRTALIWHIEQNGTKVAELARVTGVSRDAINKIRDRDNASTSAENALLIAAYYGKTLEEFIRMDGPPRSSLAALSNLLQPAEARLIEAQVRGILSSRESQ